MTDELAQMPQCLVDRMKRRQRDRQHLGVAAAVLLGIGGQQLIEADLVDRAVDCREPLGRAAQIEVAAKLRPSHQRGSGALHRRQELQAMAQRRGQLIAARAVILARRLRQ